jgi:RNA polymerase sigma-70 factor (ECF subfamily)
MQKLVDVVRRPTGAPAGMIERQKRGASDLRQAEPGQPLAHRCSSPEEAAAAIVRLMPQIERYAAQLTGCRDAAQDLAQATFERALPRLHLLDRELGAWLRTICRNLFVEQMRRDRRAALTKQVFMERAPAFIGPQQEDRVALRELRIVLELMPEEQRSTLVHYLFWGLSAEDSAKRLGIPIGTVWSRLHAARVFLRREFSVEPLGRPLRGTTKRARQTRRPRPSRPRDPSPRDPSPRDPSPRDPSPRDSAPLSNTPSTPPSHKGSKGAAVLVVDDDAEVRHAIRAVLEDAGYRVTEAEDGKVATGVFVPGAFDVVVCDITMPGKEGIELIVEMRQVAPDQQIIAISDAGRISRADYLAVASAVGARFTFAKPFRAEDLLAGIKALVGGRAGSPGTPGEAN